MNQNQSWFACKGVGPGHGKRVAGIKAVNVQARNPKKYRQAQERQCASKGEPRQGKGRQTCVNKVAGKAVCSKGIPTRQEAVGGRTKWQNGQGQGKGRQAQRGRHL